MHQQLCDGHEVHILTLTHGGATQERHKLGLSVEEMGKIRVAEMNEVKKVLQPTSWEIWDLEDGGLTHMDPTLLEILVREHVLKTKPDVLITYPQHGISGHFDHLVIHAVVKRIFCDLRMRENGPKRLAFFTLPETDGPKNPNTKHSDTLSIDCVVPLNPANIEMLKATLDCYKSYKEIVVEYKVVEHVGNSVSFEIWDENHTPPITALEQGL